MRNALESPFFGYDDTWPSPVAAVSVSGVPGVLTGGAVPRRRVEVANDR